jgi:hypothetical protein
VGIETIMRERVNTRFSRCSTALVHEHEFNLLMFSHHWISCEACAIVVMSASRPLPMFANVV